jgi:hypothetical protein
MAYPKMTLVSVNREKISDELGMNQAIITVKFDQDIQSYKAMLNGVDHTTGILVHSGTSATANTDVDIVIDWNELTSEGENRINIYGQSLSGEWTAYNQEDISNSIYILMMDGVDDYIETPYIIHDSFEIDMVYENNGKQSYIFDSRYVKDINTYLYYDKVTGIDTGMYNTNYYVDGVNKSFTNVGVPRGKRTIVKASYSVTYDENYFFFSRYTLVDFGKGIIYSIKFYNQGNLVAHYDMSKGTVQDQTGNGKHATLVGGTWLEITISDTNENNNLGRVDYGKFGYGE